MNGRTLVAVPYEQMVRAVFDPMGSQVNAVFQAAALVSVWTSYMLTSTRIEDVVGYLGSLEFAIEACKQNLPPCTVVLEAGDPCREQNISTVFTAMSTEAGSMLSLAQISWVDGEITPHVGADIRACLAGLELLMAQVCSLIGIRRADVLAGHLAAMGRTHPRQVYVEMPGNAAAY